MDNPIYRIAMDSKLIEDKYNEILHESDDELLDHNGLKINISKGSASLIYMSL